MTTYKGEIMSLKTALSSVGNGLLEVVTVVSNSQIESQMDEIDRAIKVLQEQRAELAKKLV
jgi:hypothetical protein